MKKGDGDRYLLLAATFVIWGTQHPALKLLSVELNPILLNLLRFSIAAAALIPFAPKRAQELRRKDIKTLFLLGFAGPFLFGLLNLIGVGMSTATNSAVLVNTWPLIVAVLAPFLIKERTTRRSSMGVLMGTAGAFMIATNGAGMPGARAGDLLLLLSALCIALYSIYAKEQIQKYGGLEVTLVAFASASVLLFAAALATGALAALGTMTFRQLLLILWVAVPTTALTWVIWFRSIARIGLVETSSFFLLIPLSGMLSASLFLGERITAFTLAGTALVLSGIYIAQKKN